MTFAEQIECAIARLWPDIDAICRKVGCTPLEVRRVLAAMDEIEGKYDKAYRRLA
jgi:hypothetical protein